MIGERLVVGRGIHKRVDDGASEEDVAVGVGEGTDPARSPDLRSLDYVEADSVENTSADNPTTLVLVVRLERTGSSETRPLKLARQLAG